MLSAVAGALNLPELEFLCSNMPRLRVGKLQLIPQYESVDLALPSEMRLTRAERNQFPSVEDETPAAEIKRTIAHGLGGVADAAALIAQNFEIRRGAVQGGVSIVIVAMTGCLDLRQMAAANVGYFANAERHLRILADWARRETTVLHIGASTHEQLRSGLTLPPHDSLYSEFCALVDALATASKQMPHKQRWQGASSSSVLMADIFKLSKFFERCPNLVFLYEHCALKCAPEAVVEGMGSVWDRCATPGRHLNFVAGAQEAVICWNALQPYTDCNDFCDRSLAIYFKGKPLHVTHTSAAVAKRAEQSKVVQKLRRVPPKLPASLRRF